MSRPPAPRPRSGESVGAPAPAAPAPAVPAVRTVRSGSTAAASAAASSASHAVRTFMADVPGGIDGAPRWVSGVLAGAQAALLSLLVVVMPALAAYVATSADPSNAEIGWLRSVGVGATLWLMGHGGPVQVDGATVSLVPLGVTGLALFAAYASARRSAHPTASAWAGGLGGYAAVVLVVTLLVGAAGPVGAGGAAVARLVLGTMLVAAVGLGMGVVRLRRLRLATRHRWSRLPVLLRAGATAGTMAVAVVVGMASIVTGVWVVSGRAATGDVVEGLGLDTFGGLLLAVAQLAVAPNLVLWVVAWLAGPGFAVGAGTVFAPAEVVSGPLPALPMLGALPAPGSEGGPTAWAPVLVVLAGALAGWWLHRRTEVTRAWQPFAGALVAGAWAGVLAGLVTLLAGGAVGPGRLTDVGGPVLLVAACVAGLCATGALLTAVLPDPVVRAAVVRYARAAWHRVRD